MFRESARLLRRSSRGGLELYGCSNAFVWKRFSVWQPPCRVSMGSSARLRYSSSRDEASGDSVESKGNPISLLTTSGGD